MNSDNVLIRLQVFLSRAGIASRRKCEELIAAGRVTVNGSVVAEPGTKVSAVDEIVFDGKRVIPEEKKISIAVHKPVQMLCSSRDDQGRALVSELFSKSIPERLFHAGRLDFMSSGLIIYTNDGELAKKITHPSFTVEKEYEVTAFGTMPDDMLTAYLKGIVLDGDLLKLNSFTRISEHTVRLVLAQGKNREIRRVCSHFSVCIKTLCRIRIGPVVLDNLPVGHYRFLAEREIAWFLKRNPVPPGRPE